MRRSAVVLLSGFMALGVVLAAFMLAGFVLNLANKLHARPQYRVTWLEK